MQNLIPPSVMGSPRAAMMPVGSPQATTMPSTAPNQPSVGPQIPGTLGSLAAPPGLSVYNNPMAQQLQSQGRGQDSMLVHMTPGEVNTLQGLARAAGGSLTVNPHTGLPEAGFLSSLLPMLGGALLNVVAPGLGAIADAGIVGAADTALTGSLKSGLMAGLGAFGGASMAGGLSGAVGTAGQAADTASTTAATAEQTAAAVNGATTNGVLSAADVPAGTFASTGASSAALPGLTPASVPAGTFMTGAGPTDLVPTSMGGTAGAATFTPNAGQTLVPSIASNAAGTNPGFMQGFTNTAQQGLSGNMAKYAPYAAGLGVANSLAGAFQSTNTAPQQQVPVYKGPYHYADPSSSLTNKTPLVMGSNGVYQQPTGMGSYYPQSQLLDAQGNPYVYETAPINSINQYGGTNLPGYAEGGAMPIKDGSFIVDARTVSELGNGSSGAGQEVLAKHGGKPLHGPGDGVSDSIPASIGGVQKARVARDEVKFDPEDVQRIGNGDHSQGVKKLYAIMDKARTARKNAKPGQDTKLAKGLGSL